MQSRHEYFSFGPKKLKLMTPTKLDITLRKYPWLNRVNSVEEYLPPQYYKQLLRRYTFNGVSDLQLLEVFLRSKKPSSILELGCGNGRASEVVVSAFPRAQYTFSDLSVRMLASAKQRLPNGCNFIQSDAVEFLQKTKEVYDFVYTLWSFSHSVHQHIHKLGFEKAKQYVVNTLAKFIHGNLSIGGAFFLIHFDSLSDEQRILMRQWRRVFPAFNNLEYQSPSKQIIDGVLLELDNTNYITLSVEHLRGDPIRYESEGVLLETFMNFHLETYFNRHILLKNVIEDIKKHSAQYRNEDGSYSISPGCYVYSFHKRNRT